VDLVGCTAAKAIQDSFVPIRAPNEFENCARAIGSAESGCAVEISAGTQSQGGGRIAIGGRCAEVMQDRIPSFGINLEDHAFFVATANFGDAIEVALLVHSQARDRSGTVVLVGVEIVQDGFCALRS
jgi:hypothetical protein